MVFFKNIGIRVLLKNHGYYNLWKTTHLSHPCVAATTPLFPLKLLSVKPAIVNLQEIFAMVNLIESSMEILVEIEGRKF